MEIQYRTTRRDAWRCTLHAFLHRPENWRLHLMLPAAMTWFVYWLYPAVQASLYRGSSHHWWLPAIFLAIFAEVLLPRLAAMRKKISHCYPNTENRSMTTTTLTPDSLCDHKRRFQASTNTIVITPVQISWKDIIDINWHESALYFVRKNGTTFIPHSAFENPSQAQQFLDLAQSYWQSARSGVEAPTPQGVWPPAPRPGA